MKVYLKLIGLMILLMLSLSACKSESPFKKSETPDANQVADMQWFTTRFGYSTFYNSQTMKLESFSLEEYRKLIKAFKDHSEPTAITVLHYTVYKHLSTMSEDLQYQNLKSDLYSKAFLTKAISVDSSLIEYVPSTLSFYKELVLKAIETSPYVLRFVSDELKDDDEVVQKAIKIDRDTLSYASTRLIQKYADDKTGSR